MSSNINFFPNIVSISDSGRYEIIELVLYSNKNKRVYIFDKFKKKYIMTSLFTNNELLTSKWLTIDNDEYIIIYRRYLFCYKRRTLYKL